MLNANNKVTDQSVDPHRLIGIIVIRWLDSIITQLIMHSTACPLPTVPLRTNFLSTIQS